VEVYYSFKKSVGKDSHAERVGPSKEKLLPLEREEPGKKLGYLFKK
jgi:hypothetical protein